MMPAPALGDLLTQYTFNILMQIHKVNILEPRIDQHLGPALVSYHNVNVSFAEESIDIPSTDAYRL
jgi:hypothetical protein